MVSFLDRANLAYELAKKYSGIGLMPIDGQLEEASVVRVIEALVNAISDSSGVTLEDDHTQALGPLEKSGGLQQGTKHCSNCGCRQAT